MNELEELSKENNSVSYDSDSSTFAVKFLDDVNEMYEYYMNNPVVRESINHEIEVRRNKIHEFQNPMEFTSYAVKGFIFQHRGEMISVTKDELGDWVKE